MHVHAGTLAALRHYSWVFCLVGFCVLIVLVVFFFFNLDV